MSVRGIRKIEGDRTGRPRRATVRLLADVFGLAGGERERFFRTALGAGSGVRPAALSGLVGRVGELAALRAAAEAAAGDRFRIVWVGGEPGVGKSSLVRAAATALARDGWATAVGASPEVDGAPSAWAWADVAQALVGTGTAVGDELVERLQPLIAADAPAPDRPAMARFWAARAVVDLLGRCARLRPVLVVLEDVHRAGEGTLQILRYAAAELADLPVLVLGTLRPTEVDAALSAAMAALAGPRASRLDLGGLAEAEVGRLLRERLGEPLGPDAVRLIASRTGGNPLFVGETARLIADEGLAAAVELVPPGLGEVLRRRVDGVPERARDVLRTVAVFGMDVEVEVLLSVAPEEAEAVVDGLEAAVRAGLLAEPAPGVVRFRHVLIRDAIYQDLSGVRRARLHARVLGALRRTRPHDLVTQAHHALASATPTTARAAATRAAEAARSAVDDHAHADAAALLTGALAVVDRLPDRPAGGDELRLDLLCALVSAQGHAGNVRAARRSRAHAIRVARRLGDHRGLARAYTSYDAPTLWTPREYQELDRTLVEDVESTLATEVGDDPATRCRLLATLAIEVEATDPERTDQASAEAVKIADGLDDPVLLCRALNARYRYVTTLGPDRWPELDGIGDRQLQVAAANGLNACRAQAHHILSVARLARNDLAGAQTHLDRAVDHATSGQLGLALTIIAMFRGLRELVAGRFEAAERAYAPVIAQLRHIGSPNAEEMDLLVRFCVEHARSGPDSPRRMAELAERARPVYEHFGPAVVEPYARLLIGAGRPDEARAVWRPDVVLPRDHYWFRWTALRAENAVRLHDLQTAAGCYRQLLPWRGHLPGLLHAHITLGPVDHVLGELAAALGHGAAAARHFADAAEVAGRLGAPHWAVRARAAAREAT